MGRGRMDCRVSDREDCLGTKKGHHYPRDRASKREAGSGRLRSFSDMTC